MGDTGNYLLVVDSVTHDRADNFTAMLGFVFGCTSRNDSAFAVIMNRTGVVDRALSISHYISGKPFSIIVAVTS